jgi:WD40 repeat protein
MKQVLTAISVVVFSIIFVGQGAAQIVDNNCDDFPLMSRHVSAFKWNHAGTAIATASQFVDYAYCPVRIELSIFNHIQGSTVAYEIPLPNVLVIEWQPDDEKIVLGSGNGTIYVFNIMTGLIETSIPVSLHPITTLSYSTIAHQLLAGGWDNTIYQFDSSYHLIESRLIDSNGIPGRSRGIVNIIWHPNGRFLATSSITGNVKIWNINNLQLVNELNMPIKRLAVIAWRPDGLQLATGSTDGIINFWSFNEGDLTFVRAISAYSVNPARQTDSYIAHLEWSPNGTQIGSIGLEDNIKVWDSNTGVLVQVIGEELSITHVDWHSTSGLAYAGTTYFTYDENGNPIETGNYIYISR